MNTYLFVFSDGASHLRQYASDTEAVAATTQERWGTSTVRAVWPVADSQRDRLNQLGAPPAPAPLYPAHEKLAKVTADAQVVGEFLDWAGSQGVILGQHQQVEGYRDPQFVPLAEHRDAVLARHFGIDLDKIETEKRAMLAAIRAANES